jgi:hypothetical protein
MQQEIPAMHVGSRGVVVAPPAAYLLYSKFVNETDRSVASGRQMSLRLYVKWSLKYNAASESGPDIMKTYTHNGGNTPCIRNISTDIKLWIRFVQILWVFKEQCPGVLKNSVLYAKCPVILSHKNKTFSQSVRKFGIHTVGGKHL